MRSQQRPQKYEITNLHDHLVKSSPMTKLLFDMGGKQILEWYYRVAYGQRKKMVEKLVAPGRLLDVGCESGMFLRQFGPRWKVAGVEINSRIKKYPGLNIWIGDISRYKTRNKFEVVTLWHVLEHLDKIKDQIANIKKLLLPGGYVVIEVPNGDSWYMRVFGKYWRLWMYPQHRWFWTGESLKRLLEENGFEVKKIEYLGLLSSGPGSLADWAKSPWLGLVSIPVFVVINLFLGKGRDNVRVVARKV